MENNSLLRVNCSIFGMIQTTFSFHSPLTPHPYQGLGRGDWIGKRTMKTAFHPPPVSVSLTTCSVSFAFVNSWSKLLGEELETSA